MFRHNASPGGPGIIVNLLSQCVVSVSAESHTQAAGRHENRNFQQLVASMSRGALKRSCSLMNIQSCKTD